MADHGNTSPPVNDYVLTGTFAESLPEFTGSGVLDSVSFYASSSGGGVVRVGFYDRSSASGQPSAWALDEDMLTKSIPNGAKALVTVPSPGGSIVPPSYVGIAVKLVSGNVTLYYDPLAGYEIYECGGSEFGAAGAAMPATPSGDGAASPDYTWGFFFSYSAGGGGTPVSKAVGLAASHAAQATRARGALGEARTLVAVGTDLTTETPALRAALAAAHGEVLGQAAIMGSAEVAAEAREGVVGAATLPAAFRHALGRGLAVEGEGGARVAPERVLPAAHLAPAAAGAGAGSEALIPASVPWQAAAEAVGSVEADDVVGAEILGQEAITGSATPVAEVLGTPVSVATPGGEVVRNVAVAAGAGAETLEVVVALVQLPGEVLSGAILLSAATSPSAEVLGRMTTTAAGAAEVVEAAAAALSASAEGLAGLAALDAGAAELLGRILAEAEAAAEQGDDGGFAVVFYIAPENAVHAMPRLVAVLAMPRQTAVEASS